MSGFQIVFDPEPLFFVFFAQNADHIGAVRTQTFSPAVGADVLDDRIGLPDADDLVMSPVPPIGLAFGYDVNSWNFSEVFVDGVNLEIIISPLSAKHRLADGPDRFSSRRTDLRSHNLGTFG